MLKIKTNPYILSFIGIKNKDLFYLLDLIPPKAFYITSAILSIEIYHFAFSLAARELTQAQLEKCVFKYILAQLVCVSFTLGNRS